MCAALISGEVKADTRKLSSFEAFEKGLGADAVSGTVNAPAPANSLQSFADQRRAYLLNHSEIKKAAH
jgi:hypothetical protein